MDWDTDIKPIVTSMIRHAFSVAAGALATAGLALTPDQTTQFEAGGTAVVLYLIGQGWAIWQKRHQKAAVATAAATGVVK